MSARWTVYLWRAVACVTFLGGLLLCGVPIRIIAGVILTVLGCAAISATFPTRSPGPNDKSHEE